MGGRVSDGCQKGRLRDRMVMEGKGKVQVIGEAETKEIDQEGGCRFPSISALCNVPGCKEASGLTYKYGIQGSREALWDGSLVASLSRQGGGYRG